MTNPHRTITRRGVLRGAGAMLSLPFLESLVPALARAADLPVPKEARPPLRMGIFTVTGGTVLESWRLPQPGPLGALPSILRPLEPLKDDLLLITGLAQSGRSEGLNAHEHCGYLHLTCAEQVKKEGGKPVAAISVDQVAARAVGGQTFLPSLEMGLSNAETKYSFRSPYEAVPYEPNPRLVFERMFRGRQPVVPNWQRRAAARAEAVSKTARRDSYEQGVVDLVLEEAKELRGRLGAGDQQKLDEYLHSVRAVEKRLDFLEARLQEEVLDAAQPGSSKLVLPKNLPGPEIPFYQIANEIHRDPEKHGEYIRLMSDLMVLAFQTDTTRVVTLAIGDDGAYFPGVVTVGYERHCHTLEHQGNAGRVEDADPIAREACRQIHAWYTGFFAEMVAKMKAIDEGGTSLLDNSLILYTSYMADGGHGTNDYPALLAGRAQGTLRTGRQVTVQPKTPVANLYVELLDRIGAKVDAFGDSRSSPHAAYDGRLPGLA
ncbi:MAG: DUF1552 domain-containing protein [Armatimonadota bacterium]